ncbi:MAG: (2Fe-2S)-binding protein [Candidatus Caldatribacteriota bacterium]|nr:(2Fe-2S)-binding protein [Candidatus Caldatribacteriota bacterium]
MEEYKIELIVNNEKISAITKAEESLLKFLRRNGFTEVKCGCEKGDCGTCTVIMNGKTIKSCITLAMQANGKEILTAKGLEKIEIGRRLQESFVKYGAVQCGFCTAGMLMAAKSYIDKDLEPDKTEIRKAISGNLCRCTGYKKIVEAIYDVAVKSHGLEGDTNV